MHARLPEHTVESRAGAAEEERGKGKKEGRREKKKKERKMGKRKKGRKDLLVCHWSTVFLSRRMQFPGEH